MRQEDQILRDFMDCLDKKRQPGLGARGLNGEGRAKDMGV
jgi:hypothetical protein